MLVLSRKVEEAIRIDDRIRLTVLAIRGSVVRIGIEAPDDVGITRQEILEVRPTDRADGRPGRASRGRGAPRPLVVS